MDQSKEVLIHTAAGLQQCCAQLAKSHRFGFDTEFVGEESYHPRLCLIQVATNDALYLIDPLALPSLEPFWQLVVDPANQVVVHAGREEVRLCHIWSGETPGNLFDLQIAAGLVGFPYPLSHGALVGQVLGKKMAKAETLTEWRTRPLTKEQIRYAFDDVRYLLPVWRELGARLEKLGRIDWAEEEFGRLREMATPDDEGLAVSADKWRKLRGIGSLDRRKLAVLRELFYWREKAAADANRPARTIVRDDLLVEITRRNPKSARDLTPVRGLAKRYLDDIFQAIERGRALPPEDCPVPTEREQDPLQVSMIANLVGAVLNDVATKEQVAPSLAGTSADVKTLVKAHIQGKPPPPECQLLKGWRARHLLPHLQAILEGKRSLRIADVKSETPFAYGE